MRYLARPPLGVVVALLTVGSVVLIACRSGGSMFSPGPLNAQGKGAGLGGVHSHAELAHNCSACHVPPWSRETMADRCLSCHQDIREQIVQRLPLHGQLSAGMQCRACHTEHRGARAAITRLEKFDHDLAAFQLTGAHTAAACQKCHQNNFYKGTPTACVGCHAEPAVHLGKFGTDCASCHSTATWKEAVFDHNRTAFKLTGAHTSVNCQSCHRNSTFKGTPTSCVSCHAEPVVHLGKYGTGCASCHSTATWKGAVFEHKAFPVNHGNRRGAVDCKRCHQGAPTEFQSYTCYGCHEHNRDKMVRVHARRKVVNLDKCIDCHKRGRKGGGRERERERRTEAPGAALGLEPVCAAGGGCDLACAREGLCPEMTQDAEPELLGLARFLGPRQPRPTLPEVRPELPSRCPAGGRCGPLGETPRPCPGMVSGGEPGLMGLARLLQQRKEGRDASCWHGECFATVDTTGIGPDGPGRSFRGDDRCLLSLLLPPSPRALLNWTPTGSGGTGGAASRWQPPW